MSKEEFIESIKKITYLPNENFFLEYNNVIYNILDQKEELQQRIDKAIEYINDRYDGEVLTHTFDKCNVGEIYEILKGENNE